MYVSNVCVFIPFADGYAPFLSLTSRNLAFTIQNTDVNVPGPGHYDIAKIQVKLQ